MRWWQPWETPPLLTQCSEPAENRREGRGSVLARLLLLRGEHLQPSGHADGLLPGGGRLTSPPTHSSWSDCFPKPAWNFSLPSFSFFKLVILPVGNHSWEQRWTHTQEPLPWRSGTGQCLRGWGLGQTTFVQVLSGPPSYSLCDLTQVTWPLWATGFTSMKWEWYCPLPYSRFAVSTKIWGAVGRASAYRMCYVNSIIIALLGPEFHFLCPAHMGQVQNPTLWPILNSHF